MTSTFKGLRICWVNPDETPAFEDFFSKHPEERDFWYYILFTDYMYNSRSFTICNTINWTMKKIKYDGDKIIVKWLGKRKTLTPKILQTLASTLDWNDTDYQYDPTNFIPTEYQQLI
jgi:hypothetical protein